MNKPSLVGVYIDACVWKQSVHMDENGSEFSAKCFRIVSAGNFMLLCSSVLQVEALSFSLAKQIESYDGEKVKVIHVDRGICRLAYDLRKSQFENQQKNKNAGLLKTGDALHLACAMQGRARYLISRDRKFINAVKMSPQAGHLEVLEPEGFCEKYKDVIEKTQYRLELNDR